MGEGWGDMRARQSGNPQPRLPVARTIVLWLPTTLLVKSEGHEKLRHTTIAGKDEMGGHILV